MIIRRMTARIVIARTTIIIGWRPQLAKPTITATTCESRAGRAPLIITTLNRNFIKLATTANPVRTKRQQPQGRHSCNLLATSQKYSRGGRTGMVSWAWARKCPLVKPSTTYPDSAPITSRSFKFHAVRSMPPSLRVSAQGRQSASSRAIVFMNNI